MLASRSSGSAVRAATALALWAAAWRGGANADDVLQALRTTGPRAGIRADTQAVADRSGLPGPGEPTGGLVDLLALLRRGGPPALVLPVPGDVRGAPADGALLLRVLDAGAMVVLPEPGVGLLPQEGHWRVVTAGPAHATLSVPEATRLLDAAIGEATEMLTAADLASSRGNPRAAVRDLILADSVPTPPGMPTAAAGLLARATTLAALLDVAAGHETAAVTSRECAVVDDALAPLRAAVREARRTAVAATVAAFASDRSSLGVANDGFSARSQRRS